MAGISRISQRLMNQGMGKNELFIMIENGYDGARTLLLTLSERTL